MLERAAQTFANTEDKPCGQKEAHHGGGVLFKGMLVELPGRRGIGRLVSVAGGRCTVSAFYSVLRSELSEFPLKDLVHAYLSPQTRVFVEQDGRFRVGRVTNYLIRNNGLVEYEVRFPNGRQADFSETRLFVRAWNAPEDPAEVLAAGGAESQYLHDRRNAANGALLSLRSAAQGLTSIPSAGVDFVPHQVAAVRRVLTDPIQRYLLADEVGLGKTIEAGLIVRQHLIDDPDTSVLIVVPSHLREQWRAELSGKLRLNQFGEAFECVSHADLERVTRVPDILVVDEAHHLVGTAAGPLARSAGRLRELAVRTTVLLLLSATPALGDGPHRHASRYAGSGASGSGAVEARPARRRSLHLPRTQRRSGEDPLARRRRAIAVCEAARPREVHLAVGEGGRRFDFGGADGLHARRN